MRVLVTWGSKRGGTEGIARMLGEALKADGIEVDILPPGQAVQAATFDAAVVGGALYASRWHRDARRFVNLQTKRLRRVPVWFFSSGPLDDSADRGEIPPVKQARALMDRVGAQGHITFGGRLTPDARGFPASAMAKTHSGDWRRPDRIRAWASEIARALPTAVPGTPLAAPGRSAARLVVHGAVGWAACAAAMAGVFAVGGVGAALVTRALAAPFVFSAVSRSYFRPAGARDPLPTAFAFAIIAVVLDLAVFAAGVRREITVSEGVLGVSLPLFLVFVTTWITGEIVSTLPAPKAPVGAAQARGA